MVISEVCIKRPVLATVLSIIIVALGLILYSKMQIRGTPDIDPPIISIITSYSGADVEFIEKRVTKPIEDAVKNIKFVKKLFSTSYPGSSRVILEFRLDADLEVALSDIRSKISEIRSFLPDEINEPIVSRFDSDSWPTMFLAISSDKYDPMKITQIVESNLKSALERLPSVGEAKIFGERKYSIRILPDLERLVQYQLLPYEVIAAITSQNKSFATGSIRTPEKEFTINLNSSLNTVEEFENIIVKSNKNDLVRLSNISNVKLDAGDIESFVRYKSKSAIALGLIKQSESNLLELSKQVKQNLDKIKKDLPEGINVDIAYDAAIPVDASIRAVFSTIVEAITLVILVIFLFLGSYRITLIPTLAIPISIIGAFAFMYYLGFSINIFTLLAMILAIGLVVDDAIVMLENIYRHVEEGKSVREASLIGSRQIGFAVIAMTLTLAAVFLPIGFMEGFIGKLFIEFAWTLAFCVIVSGFVALTLTPMMCSLFIKRGEKSNLKIVDKFQDIISNLQIKYMEYLDYILINKKKFALINLTALVLIILSFMFVKKDFIPQEDDSILQVIFTGPKGSSLRNTDKAIKSAEEILAKNDNLKGYFTIGGWQGNSNEGFAFVPLKNWGDRSYSQQEVRDELNSKLSKIPNMTIFAINPGGLGGGGSQKPVEFNIVTNKPHEDLAAIAELFLSEMKKYDIFKNPDSELKKTEPTLAININRDKAQMLGVSVLNIGQSMEALLAGKTIGDFKLGSEIYRVYFQLPIEDRAKFTDLDRLFIKNTRGQMVALSSVTDIKETTSIRELKHRDSLNSALITSDLKDGISSAQVLDTINIIASKVLNKDEASVRLSGGLERFLESNAQMLYIFGLAILFIYLILAAQFESFKDPFIILLSVPFSILGAVLTLVIFGNSLNMYSNIGLITLVGLVTKNSIMIVEFANQLVEEGKKHSIAIIEACNLRFRPILMTSLATIFGAVPLMLASGAGAAARNSLGYTIVGGMLVGTIFTLFVIPFIYRLVKK